MTSKVTLAIAILGMLLFASCKKEENTVINNYQLVSINFNPAEFIVKTSQPFAKASTQKRASVTKPQAEAFEFKAEKPANYYAYFIVGSEVVHKFNNIVEGNQKINVQKRTYDIIVVSSVELSDQALRKYNNEQEHQQKLLYALPETSSKLILSGAIYNTNIQQGSSVKVTVYNAHAAIIFFNSDEVRTQNDVPFLQATKGTTDYHYLYIKDRNAQQYGHTFNAGFKFKAGGPQVNITEAIESNKVYKFFINRGYVEGNFEVEVAPLLTETVFKEVNGQ